MKSNKPKVQRLHAKPLENVELKKFSTYMGGFQWLYRNKTTGDELSVICHSGSYGGSCGYFEIYPYWVRPTKGDDVEGWLTFYEVGKWLERLNKRKVKVIQP